MKFFKKFAAVLIAMAVFTVGNIGILPGDAVEDFMLSVRAEDSDIVDSGECGAQGDNLTWTLDNEGTLTISGEGEMMGWDIDADSPWSCRKDILNVIVGKGVISIGNSAFTGCVEIHSIELPDTLKSIGDFAFSECSKLNSIKIPDSVVNLGYHSFMACYSLTSIMIPEGVEKIGDITFELCTNLKTVTIPYSVKLIESYAFNSCESLENVYYAGTEIDWKCIEVEKGNGYLTNAEINYAENAEYRIIDSGECGVKGDNIIWTFDNNGTFTITGEGEMASYDYHDGDYYGDDYEIDSTAPWRYYGNQIREVIVKGNVKNIGNYSFNGCKNLKYVILPTDIEEIGEFAFANCEKLTSVTGGSNSTKFYSTSFKNSPIVNNGVFCLLDSSSTIESNGNTGSLDGLINYTVRYKFRDDITEKIDSLNMYVVIPKGLNPVEESFVGVDYPNYEIIQGEDYVIDGGTV